MGEINPDRRPVVKRLKWRRTRRALDRLRSPDALAVLDLDGCPPGPGRTYGAIVWIGLASHLRWGTQTGRVYVNDQTLARELGLSVRAVEQGIRYLVRIRRLERSHKPRGLGARRRWGRVLHMQFDGLAPIVVLPPADQVREMWNRVRRLTKRAAETFAVALAANVVGRSLHRRMRGPRFCEVSVGRLARLLGMSRGGAFNRRLQRLVDAGILDKIGERWRGFVVIGKLAETYEELRARLRCEFPSRWTEPSPERRLEMRAEARLAAMSEAFSAMYP